MQLLLLLLLLLLLHWTLPGGLLLLRCAHASRLMRGGICKGLLLLLVGVLVVRVLQQLLDGRQQVWLGHAELLCGGGRVEGECLALPHPLLLLPQLLLLPPLLLAALTWMQGVRLQQVAARVLLLHLSRGRGEGVARVRACAGRYAHRRPWQAVGGAIKVELARGRSAAGEWDSNGG